jgi:flagellar biosynthetic protein FlhB
MESGSQDRNLPASQRKLQKARDDGQVSRSHDLSHLAILGTGCAALLVLAPVLFGYMKKEMARQLSFDAQTVKSMDYMLTRLHDGAAVGVVSSAIFGALVISATILAAVASGGWVQSLKPLMPDLGRLSPLRGFGNLFSKQKLLNTAKMLVLTGVLLTITALFLSHGFAQLAALILQPSSNSIGFVAQWISHGLGLLLLVVLLAAMVDVPLQSFLHKDQMKMSHQEVKQEGKESDGNPQMKSKMRQRQRETSQKSSINAVPRADFVVMNPTHFAVAIQYDEKTMRAPQVISKGADLLAMRIRDVAKQHAIPVLQSPVLARALYANAQLNQDIPSALYTAVAQVLAYVYRLRNAMQGKGPMPAEMPQPLIPLELDPLTKTKKEAAA